jgi:hypothetical protein
VIVEGKGKLSVLDEMDKLLQCLADVYPILWRIAVYFGVPFKFIFVEDGVGVVGLYQKVNVKVDEREDACFESGRGINVAVELEQTARRGLKAEDAVPLVCPEKFGAVCSGLNSSNEWVSNFFREESIEDDK